MVDLKELIADLGAEHDELDAVVAPLADPEWDIETPSPGWTIRDQVAHLTFFDEQAILAVDDPDAFAAGLSVAAADIGAYMDGSVNEARAMEVSEVLDRWRSARARMLNCFEGLEPGRRIAWFGPPMSPASFISARLMETWAHGQDVFDALGQRRQPTDRLRHIAFLGVRARSYSYLANGLDEPDEEVAVELKGPSGDVWSWNEDAPARITGSALGFCLVVTRRRHPDDTDLEAHGALAEEWLGIAQCFAGPGGEGRKPGQFEKQ